MTTVVDLTDQEIAKLQELTQQTDAAAAVRIAMSEYVRYVRRLRLKALSGQVQMQDHGTPLNKADVRAGHENAGPGTD